MARRHRLTPYAPDSFVTFDLPAYASRHRRRQHLCAELCGKSVADTAANSASYDKSFAMQNGIFTLAAAPPWGA